MAQSGAGLADWTAVAPSPELRRGTWPGWAVGLAIAAPFLAAIAALRGLTVALPIFHSTDELVYHYPTILRFSHQLPFPDLASYHAAQTPLFHLLMAYVGKVVGYELWRLRLVEALISYLLALAVYGLLRRRLRLAQPAALALTVLFVLSPYVYGTSFRVITDNLATLFIVLALDRFERFRETQSLGPFAAGCAAVGAAMLTRQSAAFMVGVAALYGLGTPLSRRRRVIAAGTLAAACAPVAALFLTWHGLVPPGGNPASCGLCSGAGGAGLEVRTPELALATIGLYGLVLFGPELVTLARAAAAEAPRRLLSRPTGSLRAPLLGAFAGVVLLLAFPAHTRADSAGLIWAVARHVPAVLGTPLVFWALVPAAGAILVWRIRAAPRRWIVVVFTACFLLGTLVIRYPWQKYVDPFALLIVMMTVRPRELVSPRALAGAAVLALAFIVYTADYSSHANRQLAATRITRITVEKAPSGGAFSTHIRPSADYDAAANPSATFGQLTTFHHASM
ncbi:MAG TPA: glycosyltransferase family 39 protein [Solirubrobacteraceae bacterium]|nr:glycosyltransferase family 39 protein [Solirubrobacteraceae bacterium]